MGSHAPCAHHTEHSHVLHEDGISPRFVELQEQPPRSLQFFVVYDSVHRDIHTSPITVGITAQLGNVAYRVADGGTCAEARRTYVDGVCPVVYRGLAALQVAGRCKQFERSHYPILVMS